MKKLIVYIIVAMALLTSTACPAGAPSTTATTVPFTSITPSTAPVITSPVQAAGSLEQRLGLLTESMEQQRRTLHVPGMALAVVKDDKIILTRGFGLSDLEKQTPVTPDTVFAIGSATKAFTSTLVGMMVDEGKMKWDDPVTQYLPYFHLNIQSSNPGDQVTLADVMSHRTGFPRMGILMASGKVPLEEILHDATAAEPYAPFREKFYYSNEVYMSAGVTAAKAAGSDWNTLVKERIIQPLGMKSTTTSYNTVINDSRLSSGYLWDEDTHEFKLRPLRNVENIAPAGAINSNVLDMAEWLRLLLGGGQYQGRQLISESSLQETWKPHSKIAPGIDYGLGWMLRQWNGQSVVEHGGNVDGFSAEVAMLPQSHLGFVLLTNATVTPLQSQSLNMVWESLLGEWKGNDSGSRVKELEPYTGKYIANFGAFKNATFTALVQNNRLAIDIPGQMVYELKEPDKDGKWAFAISDLIAVSFDRDASGKITGMKMYQSGLTFEIPREGITIPPEIPLVDLQKYLGSYRSEQLKITVNVRVQNNHLAVDIPGQMVYELLPPDAGGKWTFRVTAAISVSFQESANGQIDSLTMYQSGMQFLMPRTEEVRLPTVEEVLKLRNTNSLQAALKAAQPFLAEGTIYIAQAGVTGSFAMYVADKGRYRVNEDYGKYGSAATAVNGDRAWTESSFEPFDELHGKLLEQVKLSHPAVFLGDWQQYLKSIEVVRADTLNGKKVYVILLEHAVLPAMTVYMDAANGDILKSETNVVQEGGITIAVTTLYEDFREIKGLRLAFKETSSNEESGRTVTRYQSIKSGISIDDGIFTLSPP